MIGRPTDRSATLNVVPAAAGEIFVRWGSGARAGQTAPRACLAGRPVEIGLTGLDPDTTCCYTVMFRPDAAGDFAGAADGCFHTARARRSPFIFTIQADAHLTELVVGEQKSDAGSVDKEGRARLYQRTLVNVLADRPDFHIDLGDFARIEVRGVRSATSRADARERYLAQRRFLGALSPSVPFFLVLGNHEAEQGWRLAGGDSLPVWGAAARTGLIPNPRPDGFYSGNSDSLTAGLGPVEDYYAWEWGDALFVVLDPYRYTETRPHNLVGAGFLASLDGWDWTLGERQYRWLHEVLSRSSARWKFVFAHNLTGGVLGSRAGEGYYGRGGADAARYSSAGHASFEWGGEDASGEYVFETRRPGWPHGSIHEMLVANGVDVVFRGHDHIFVREVLDGIVYQTCPDVADWQYGAGYYSSELFSRGIKVNNSGHLRVAVSPDSIRVDYVRSVLPEDDPLDESHTPVSNGDVSYGYVLKAGE